MSNQLTGAERIAAERARQVAEEGWTAGHDAWHTTGALADAAACYLLPPERVHVRHLLNSARGLSDAYVYEYSTARPEQVEWPWEGDFYKRTPGNRIRELEKAGALIAAEIDRLLALQPEREAVSEAAQEDDNGE